MPDESLKLTPPKAPAAPANLRTVRALVVLDPGGGGGRSVEEEFSDIVRIYEEDFHLKLNATLSHAFNPATADRSELVIFDWGGMNYGNDLLAHQMRALIRWTEDHPSTLVIIRSMLSWTYLQGEVEASELPRLPNVIEDNGRMTMPSWWLASGTGDRANDGIDD